MRTAIALPLLFLLGACEADVNDTNDSVTLEYEENLAENTVADVSNEAQQIGGQIVNDVQETAGAVENQVDDVDVNVDADVSAEEGSEAQ